MTDTAAKRLSMMNLGRAWLNDPPLPDGSIEQGDRKSLLSLYAGTLTEPPAPPLRRVLRGMFGGGLSSRGKVGGGTRIRGR